MLIELNSLIEPIVVTIDTAPDSKDYFLESIVWSSDDKKGNEKEEKRKQLYTSIKDIEERIKNYVSSNMAWNEYERILFYETNDICREIDRMIQGPVQQKDYDKLWKYMWALSLMRTKIDKQASKNTK